MQLESVLDSQRHLLVQQQVQQRGGDNAKERLNQGLTLLLGRSCTKDDCVYEMSEENKKHIATLTIPELTSATNEFKGKPAQDKKSAQQNAARKAVNMLGKEIKEAKKVHDAEKAEKEKARKEERDEKMAAKKAEKEAAKAE